MRYGQITRTRWTYVQLILTRFCTRACALLGCISSTAVALCLQPSGNRRGRVRVELRENTTMCGDDSESGRGEIDEHIDRQRSDAGDTNSRTIFGQSVLFAFKIHNGVSGMPLTHRKTDAHPAVRDLHYVHPKHAHISRNSYCVRSSALPYFRGLHSLHIYVGWVRFLVLCCKLCQ